MNKHTLICLAGASIPAVALVELVAPGLWKHVADNACSSHRIEIPTPSSSQNIFSKTATRFVGNLGATINGFQDALGFGLNTVGYCERNALLQTGPTAIKIADGGALRPAFAQQVTANYSTNAYA